MSEITLPNSWNKSHNENDFERLFLHYYAPLCAYAFKIVKQKENCEEIVQTLFLKLWEDQKKLNIENLKAYLYRSTFHRCLHVIAHRNIQEKHQKSNEKNASSYPSPEEGMLMGEMYDAYLDELNKLPANTREIFLLSRDSKLKYSEIAIKKFISEKTVESHISKALKALRIRFNIHKNDK